MTTGMLGISSISDTRIMNMTGLAGMEHQNLMLYSQRLKQLAENVQLGVSQPSTQRSSTMIADCKSKFGISDIQELQEAYKKTIEESGTIWEASSNNHILEYRSHHRGLLRLQDNITKLHAPMVSSLDLSYTNPFLAGSYLDQTKILKLEQETIGSNLIDGVWMPGHYSLNR